MIVMATAATILLNPQTLSFLLQAATDAAQIAMDYSQGNISAEQAHANLINAGHRQRDAITAFNQQVGFYTPGPSSQELGVSTPPPKTPLEAGSPPPAKPSVDQRPMPPAPSVAPPVPESGGPPSSPPSTPAQPAQSPAPGGASSTPPAEPPPSGTKGVSGVAAADQK